MTITEKHILFWGQWPSNFVIVYQGPRGETKQFNDMAGMESYIRSLRRE